MCNGYSYRGKCSGTIDVTEGGDVKYFGSKRMIMKKRIKDILNSLNILGVNSDNYIERFLETNPKMILDIFPKRIIDDEKYKQVELFYQRVLDEDVDEWVFEKYEDNIHLVMKTLWLYSPTYVGIYKEINEISDADYYRKNMEKISDFYNEIARISNATDDNPTGELSLVDNHDLLEAILYCATREIADVFVYYEELELAIYVSGLQGHCVSVNENSNQLLQKIVTTNGLYLW